MSRRNELMEEHYDEQWNAYWLDDTGKVPMPLFPPGRRLKAVEAINNGDLPGYKKKAYHASLEHKILFDRRRVWNIRDMASTERKFDGVHEMSLEMSLQQKKITDCNTKNSMTMMKLPFRHERLAILRAASGLSKLQLSELVSLRAGRKRVSLDSGSWERGVHAPEYKNCLLLAKVLSVRVEIFYFPGVEMTVTDRFVHYTIPGVLMSKGNMNRDIGYENVKEAVMYDLEREAAQIAYNNEVAEHVLEQEKKAQADPDGPVAELAVGSPDPTYPDGDEGLTEDNGGDLKSPDTTTQEHADAILEGKQEDPDPAPDNLMGDLPY